MARHIDETGPSYRHRDPSEAELFRLGRQAMGWSEAALARTIAVSEQTVREWETGARPVPPKVAAWVGMYARGATFLETRTDEGPDEAYTS